MSDMKINIPVEKALNMIGTLLEEIPLLEGKEETSEEYQEWETELKSSIEIIYGDWSRSSLKPIYYILNPIMMSKGIDRDSIHLDMTAGKLIELKTQLTAMYKTLNRMSDKGSSKGHPYLIINSIFRNFPRFIRQMHVRHDNRGQIIPKINDEYDVQDIIHALLMLFFDDVRAEDPIPNIAGASSRIDFFLEEEKIGIEIKIANTNHRSKKIGEEIADDILKYKKRNDINYLFFFIYDPEFMIDNPIGFEKDINKCSTNNLQIKTIVSPQN
jgi:hypothetical protein